jgi:hypothetical protein
MSLAFLEGDAPWLFFAVWFLPPSPLVMFVCFVDMSVYTVGVVVLGKVLKAFRFDPLLFSGFEGVVDRSGLVATETFEKFMRVWNLGRRGFPNLDQILSVLSK